MMRCSKCATNNPSTNNFCQRCGNALAKRCAQCAAENPATADFCGKCGARLISNEGVVGGDAASDGASGEGARGEGGTVDESANGVDAALATAAPDGLAGRSEAGLAAASRARTGSAETAVARARTGSDGAAAVRPSETAEQKDGASGRDEVADGAAGSPRVASQAEVLNPSAPSVRIASEQVVTDSTALEGERKTVTALFADIKGSTELMEDLDPEEARAIIDPALKLMIDAAHRYDGYVVQSTGDGIFALFGAPVAHEDHPQRALYAALRLQEDLEHYSARLREGGNLPIEGRVGVNTGEVVVRSITTGAGQTEYTPIGYTTNLASRMQALAPTGSIAISEQTRKLVEGYFTVKALGPTRVKGVTEPVNIYEVTGLGPLRTRLQRAAGRGLTKFVGRERELEALSRAADQAKAGRGQIVAAMAEPGVGKSRLYFEFKAKNQTGWMVLETFSVSHGKASAYQPVIELLHNYFGISAEDDPRKRREKVAGKIAILDRALEDALPYLNSLLGIGEDYGWDDRFDRLGDYLKEVQKKDPLAQMDGQIKKRRTLEAIKRILIRESLNQPLMIVFEDLHWIDEQTQDMLDLLAESIDSAKVLLLVNYRPEYSHQWKSKTNYTQLQLDPLGIESADEMLSGLIGDGKDLVALKRLITERTEGNPFFVEEIVQSLFEDGVLQRNGSVKLVKSMNAVKVPTTVQAVLAARIDRLPADEKELLQTLAVLGREHSLSLIRAVVAQSDDELRRLLNDLQLGEFIYEQPAVGDTAYIFKHALTQEVAYNALLLERRKVLHERAGIALETTLADQLEDHLDELAHHYGRSDNTAKAVEYLGRAGQQALRRSAYVEATNQLTTAIKLLQGLPESSERLQRELFLELANGQALMAVKGFTAPETERAYVRARELCERSPDSPELLSVLYGLWVLDLARGKLRSAYELAEQILRLAQHTDGTSLMLYAQYALGDTSYNMGEFLRAREQLEAAISLYDSERHRRLALRYGGNDPGVVCLSYVALTLWQLGYPEQARKRSEQALSLSRSISHPLSLAFAEFSAGALNQLRRESHTAQERAQTLVALSAEHGPTDWLAWATILRGWALGEQGHHEEGVEELEKGVAFARATGAKLALPTYLCLLAASCVQISRFDYGQKALMEALATTNQHENRPYESEIHRLKGELLIKRGEAKQTRLTGASELSEAQICFERAIEIARKRSARSLELRATMSLARLLDKQGRRGEARTMLAEIYGWFTEGFDTADLKDAKALLDRLDSES